MSTGLQKTAAVREYLIESCPNECRCTVVALEKKRLAFRYIMKALPLVTALLHKDPVLAVF